MAINYKVYACTVLIDFMVLELKRKIWGYGIKYGRTEGYSIIVPYDKTSCFNRRLQWAEDGVGIYKTFLIRNNKNNTQF